MTDPRTAWDDVQDLAGSVGMTAQFEMRLTTHPPKVCEPIELDHEWPPKGAIPDEAWDMDEIMQCRVHDEYWPCQAVRDGRGVTEVLPTRENHFVMRPVEEQG